MPITSKQRLFYLNASVVLMVTVEGKEGKRGRQADRVLIKLNLID